MALTLPRYAGGREAPLSRVKTRLEGAGEYDFILQFEGGGTPTTSPALADLQFRYRAYASIALALFAIDHCRGPMIDVVLSACTLQRKRVEASRITIMRLQVIHSLTSWLVKSIQYIINNRIINWAKLNPTNIYNTRNEKRSLTRKLVGYRNWRQRWCKREGNKVLRKGK